MIDFKRKLVIAISSRALFNLDESHQLYKEAGLKTYTQFQKDNEHNTLEPGMAFPLVKKFLKLNEGRSEEDAFVEVLLLSKNTADTGLRIFNSIRDHGLGIVRAAFTGGKSPYEYARAFNADLYLSRDPADVRSALENGCPAATLWSGPGTNVSSDSLNFAFDGDAVVFSDESEEIYQTHGLDAFHSNESEHSHRPLTKGPFAGFIEALHLLQQTKDLPMTIRTAIVTARSAPSHERVIRTLRAWDVQVNESLFLGGLDKADFLAAFKADIFFDDKELYCETAAKQVASAHVPFGVANRKQTVES